MSNGTSTALALGLGVAGGAAAWYFTRDKKKTKPANDKPGADGATAPGTSTRTSTPSARAPAVGPPPPRVAGPCSLKLDKSGLTIDGERTDIATAIERCTLAGKVEWALMPDAPGAVVVELGNALTAAKLPVTMKK